MDGIIYHIQRGLRSGKTTYWNGYTWVETLSEALRVPESMLWNLMRLLAKTYKPENLGTVIYGRPETGEPYISNVYTFHQVEDIEEQTREVVAQRGMR